MQFYNRLSSPKIMLLFMLLVFPPLTSTNQLYSMTHQDHHQQVEIDTIRQDDLENEVKNLIDSTPTGFTFLFKRYASDVGVLVTYTWWFVCHPIASVKSIYERAFPVIGRGIVNSCQAIRHPVEPLKMLVTITVHPMKSVSQFIGFCDRLVIDDLPFFGGAYKTFKQFDGRIQITQENCPLLHPILMQTAERLGCQSLERVYIFKGNSYRSVLENLGVCDYSCNACQCGYTRGTTEIDLGKDLFLGVNKGQVAYVPGMSPEQLQALFARAVILNRSRHQAKTFVVNATIAGLITWLLINNTSLGSIDEYSSGLSICVGASSYQGLKEIVTPLFTQGFARSCERHADIRALEALDDPKVMSDALGKLGYLMGLKRRPLAELWRGEPDLGTRIIYLQKEFTRIARTGGTGR